MQRCSVCGFESPDNANYCAQCGAALPKHIATPSISTQTKARWDIFWLTLLGSLALSFLLIVVFNLPIFIFGLFLPLVWQLRPRKTRA